MKDKDYMKKDTEKKKKTNISSGTEEVAEEKLLGSDISLLLNKSQGYWERECDAEKQTMMAGI